MALDKIFAMKSNLIRFVIAVSVFICSSIIFVPSSYALTLGSGNCQSTYTQSAGTFDVASTFQSGNNCVVIFKTNSNSTTASGTWTVPYSAVSVTYLVVGGGGSSSRGTCGTTYGPGGGGGAVITGTSTFSGTVNITVGKGGAAYTATLCPDTSGNAGGNSIFNNLTANGGGAAGVGKTGGTSGNGNAGGTASDTGCGECGAGGGGGAGGVGGGTSAGGQGGINGLNAGAGISSSLTGSTIEYGSGGAGRSGNYYGVARGGGGSTNSSGGSGSCNAISSTGGGGSDCGGSGWGAGGSGIVVLQYQFDITAPIFNSTNSFSFAENTSTSTPAATIQVSESATITISSGADAPLFNLAASDSVTALIKFNISPNYEAPTDVGGNNIYDITLTATDTVGNSSNQSITITVTDVIDTSSFNSLTVSGSAIYRQVVTITANVTVASKVTFRAKNVIISGCKNKLTTGSSPNIIATCSWKPSLRGAVVITATAVPTNVLISGATATPVNVLVTNRTGNR